MALAKQLRRQLDLRFGMLEADLANTEAREECWDIVRQILFPDGVKLA